MINSYLKNALWLVAVLTGCGGGGTSNSVDFAAGLPTKTSVAADIAIAQVAPNVAPITTGEGNRLLVSVTVCQPGTSVCTVIDKVMLDTGSVGLRIHASALTGLLAGLPADRTASSLIGECAVFGNFYTWGTLRTADVIIATTQATALKLQVYDDSNLEAASASGCDSLYGGLADPTPTRFQFNGILGVKGSRIDNQRYFSCSAGTCSSRTQGNADQIPNPILQLATNNNGFLIQMPNIPVIGAANATGALILGINTQSNNQITTKNATPSIIPLDSQFGFQIFLAGNVYEALVDSGTSVYALPRLAQQGVPTCSNSQTAFYCPQTVVTMPIQAKASSQAKIVAGASLYIENGTRLEASGNLAFNNLATDIPSTLSSFSISALLGTPFFYGRSIYFSVDGQPVNIDGANSFQAFVAF